MFDKLITQANYRIPSYRYLNDRLIYMEYIDRHYTYDEVGVSPVDGYRFQGNLLGLFKYLGVADNLLTLTMYLNGYTNPVQYNGDKLNFKIPKMPPIPDH